MFKLILSALFFNYVSAVSKFTYSSCGSTSDLAQNVVMSIDPVLPQTDYTLFLDYELSKDIGSGTSTYKGSLNGLPFSPSTEDLCKEIANSNVTCPLKTGHISSQSKGTIPSGVTGKILLTNEWFDSDSQRILCMQFNILI